MGNFIKQYKKELKKEAKQFLFLCGEEDGKTLLTSKNANELVRLACIAVAFGYTKLFMRIAADSDRDIDEFLEILEHLDGNFILVDKWVAAFIDNISCEEVRALAREFWLERKSALDNSDFKIRNLLAE